ncbi:MAG: hypothetical protein M1540_01680 [Candidatus Bathyarchaeota archaeon]|nr:hypothetical protein [Candidatus Bathyarchaeota archaeon]
MVEKREIVKLGFEADLLKKVNALKKYYDVQSDAELVRVLVNEKARHLNVDPMETTTNGS